MFDDVFPPQVCFTNLTPGDTSPDCLAVRRLAEDFRLAGQINHPAHIVREDGDLSLSAFIPFCQFGDDMSVMGTQIPEFSQPVCSGFEKTVVEGEVCYQVDVNKYRDGLDWRESMQFGLGFLIDTNQEYDTKSFFSDKRLRKDTNNDEVSLRNYVRFEDSSKVKIYLHTVGNKERLAS